MLGFAPIAATPITGLPMGQEEAQASSNAVSGDLFRWFKDNYYRIEEEEEKKQEPAPYVTAEPVKMVRTSSKNFSSNPRPSQNIDLIDAIARSAKPLTKFKQKPVVSLVKDRAELFEELTRMKLRREAAEAEAEQKRVKERRRRKAIYLLLN